MHRRDSWAPTPQSFEGIGAQESLPCPRWSGGARLKNSGTVEWKGRFLHRINIHEGSPGRRALERLPDSDGDFTFPKQRPYYYSFLVK